MLGLSSIDICPYKMVNYFSCFMHRLVFYMCHYSLITHNQHSAVNEPLLFMESNVFDVILLSNELAPFLEDDSNQCLAMFSLTRKNWLCRYQLTKK